jgi:23S rRNA pseudouridine1911/1915/1917 synthase
VKDVCIPILYEDNHLLVVEKPANIPSQQDSSGDPDMLTLLKADLKMRYAKPGNVYLGLVHRLDRPVGGVMVFAKTSKAAARLSAQVRDRSFHKSYLAVVHGTPRPLRATLRHFLHKDAATNTVHVVTSAHAGALEAILDYEVLQNRDNLSLVQINLHTGRPHQIRVQFSAINHPLWGDQRYGAGFNSPGQQLALYSYMIDLHHPTRSETMHFCHIPPVYQEPWIKFQESLEGLQY